MLAKQIEQSYQEATRGFVEPQAMWILGASLKELCKRLGHGPLCSTTEGHPILDDEMYFVNEHGIWLVE